MKKNNLCEECNTNSPTYEVTLNHSLLLLCDYCYHILNWKNTSKEFIVKTHISTKESAQLYPQAVKDFLLPQLKELITKDDVSLLLETEEEQGMDSVLMELKENHQNLMNRFCIKNNLSYPELITGLRLFQDN